MLENDYFLDDPCDEMAGTTVKKSKPTAALTFFSHSKLSESDFIERFFN
jgi:hypothetical protein